MKLIKTLTALSLFFTLTSGTCKKDNNSDPNNNVNNPPPLTLPKSLDLTNASALDGKSSFTLDGITLTGAGLSNEWVECIPSDNALLKYHSAGGFKGIEISSQDFNCLIVDVSKLPAISKVKVAMFDNGKPSTQLAICDGNTILATSKTYTGENPENTYELNVGNRKASKLYIFSSEAIIYSITIE